MYMVILSAFIANILSDYLSLFFVRWSLALRIRSSLIVLLLSASIGIFIVLSFYFFRVVSGITLSFWANHPAEIPSIHLGLDLQRLLNPATIIVRLRNTLVFPVNCPL